MGSLGGQQSISFDGKLLSGPEGQCEPAARSVSESRRMARMQRPPLRLGRQL